MQKIIKVKAKASFYLVSIIWKMDKWVFYSKQSAEKIKASIGHQKAFIKDFRAKKP